MEDRLEAVVWDGGRDGTLRLVDQRKLPQVWERLACETLDAVVEAIATLTVRGAPAIGVAAAYGVVVGVREHHEARGADAALEHTLAALAASRPTARNLFTALERMKAKAGGLLELPRDELLDALLAEARAFHAEDKELCEAIGAHGWSLVPEKGAVLTHCHAGALATGGIGTALGVMHRAQREGVRFAAYACETRPLLQGARLTAWELGERGIPVTLVCDTMAASVMASGKVGCVIVGADRIAKNGDTANKIGTLGLAVMARHFGIPFYIAAPSSTFDLSLEDGAGIPIEERDGSEVRGVRGTPTAPDQVAVWNPAFDVTPASLIHGIITERGLITEPDAQKIEALLGSS